MATVTQNDLRIRNAHNMVQHLSSVEEPCYMFIGRPEPWMSMVEQNQELNGFKMAKALEEQGSDPEFFGLDQNGEELEE